MFTEYEKGQSAIESVLGEDGYWLNMHWDASYDLDAKKPIPGIFVSKGENRTDKLGVGAMYSLEDIELLGNSDLEKGIDVIRNAWLELDRKELGMIRPLNWMLTYLR